MQGKFPGDGTMKTNGLMSSTGGSVPFITTAPDSNMGGREAIHI